MAASSAFPPVLSPVRLELNHATSRRRPGPICNGQPYTTDVVLTDGGVYDNLGLETAWKRYQTVLVSDAGGKMQAEEEPKADWARHALRVLEVVDNQVRSLRKRQLIESFSQEMRQGTYWGIRTDIADYHLPMRCLVRWTDDEACRAADATEEVRRRTQERLINWGYAVCDAALRKHVDPAIARPQGFPYPQAGI